ncbi:MAG: glycerol-3-phosphate 1-O-acyltransferase PlsY [Caldisericia bacterium]|nr:glycerol-3-phosphate 1-O-acyltransferase PlsY [Caldisericia bacterium]
MDTFSQAKELLIFALLIIVPYIIGSIPFGLLIGLAFGIDIRGKGSGNIGATNVQRTLGWFPGLASWILDTAKGFFPVYLTSYMLENNFFGQELAGASTGWPIALVGLAVIAGHCWSVFLKFRGGKGVSTTLGVVMALDWKIGIACFILWVIIVALTRYVSVASMITAILMPFGFIFLGADPIFWVLCFAIAIIIVIKHQDNIKRLREGTENKFGSGRNSAHKS